MQNYEDSLAGCGTYSGDSYEGGGYDAPAGGMGFINTAQQQVETVRRTANAAAGVPEPQSGVYQGADRALSFVERLANSPIGQAGAGLLNPNYQPVPQYQPSGGIGLGTVAVLGVGAFLVYKLATK